jgi:hypothetical protein
MAAFAHLPDKQLRDLHTAAIDLGLVAAHRDALLAGLPPAYAADVSTHGPWSAQLLEILFAFNRVESLDDGTVPLEQWLRNALQLTRARAESAVFDKALSALAGRRWLEIAIEGSPDDLLVTARSSRGARTPPRALGHVLTAARLRSLAAAVQAAASRGEPLGASVRAGLQDLRRALLGGDAEPLLARLRGPTPGPRLLRLGVADGSLQAIPWEAACGPGEVTGFRAGPALFPVRGVASGDDWPVRVVRGALHLIVLAPGGGGGVFRLRQAIEPCIAAGEIAWLDPIEGPAARLPALLDRLGRDRVPNVIHFIGRAGLDDGVPALRLADVDGAPTWLRVADLAHKIAADARGFTRLVVLEPEEATDFTAAAELLAQQGAGAVVAYQWPVRAAVARTFAERIYEALAGAERPAGDVAIALDEARRAVLEAFEESAEAFSPVLHLRAPSSVLFDFGRRRVVPPPPQPSARVLPGPIALAPALLRLLQEPFSLLFGDQGRPERSTLDDLATRLREVLARTTPAPAGIPLSALAQRVSFFEGAAVLEAAQQQVQRATTRSRLLAELARRTGGGVHTSLLRGPLFENAVRELAAVQRLFVLQPGDAATPALLCCPPGSATWSEPRPLPTALDPHDVVVLRLYRGIKADEVVMPPLLTEDDYLFAFREIEAALPPHLAYEILRAVHTRPALIAGISLLSWDHRVVLRHLFEHRPLPFGSIVLLEPDSGERELWANGSGVSGKRGVTVVEAPYDALAEALAALPRRGAR